jgi:D-amino-acid oxidase
MEKIEHLVPPIISAATIDQSIACTRPMRTGKFNISAEHKENKIIMHCYGHGGSGCTTSWGSVEKAIELYEQQALPKAPIRVLGGGIIGLTAAIELRRKGYTVAGITAAKLYEIPSWKNAGYFALVSVQTDPAEQENLDTIGERTYLEYKKINEGKHPYITSNCARMLPVYCSEDTEAGVEGLEKKGVIPPREYVSIDFGNGVVHRNFVKFVTFFMDTTRIMLQLQREVKRLGIPIEEKEIKAFSEVPETVIFNCTGLGAKQLNHDDQLIAVRGHLMTLNEHAGLKHMDYIIYTKVKDQDGQSAYVYMFPKNLMVDENVPQGRSIFGAIGGTFIPGTDALTERQLKTLDEQEYKKLLDRNLQFFWGQN